MPRLRPVRPVPLLVGGLFTGVALRVLLLPVSPHDFWWQVATGRHIARTGSVPTADPFSFTVPGAPWFDQPWLTQLTFHGLVEAGGVPLALLAGVALVALAVGILLRLGTRLSGNAGAAALALLAAAPAASLAWSLRAQLFALPLFAASLYVLTLWTEEEPGPGLWWLPLLMALWVNVHGSFPLGLVLPALFVVGVLLGDGGRDGGAGAEAPPGRTRRAGVLAAWTLVAGLSVLVNPRGPGVLDYVRGLMADPVVQDMVAEWRPPDPLSFVGLALLGYALVLSAALVRSRRRPTRSEVLVAVAFGLLALSARRHVPWFALATAPLLARCLAEWPAVRNRIRVLELRVGPWRRPLGGLALAAVVAALPWLKPHLPWPPPLRPVLSGDTPVGAVDFLAGAPNRPGRLFHTEAAGSYLMWAAPDQPVFVDTRVELYPSELWRDYVRLGAGVDAGALTRKHGVDGLLVDRRRQAGLARWALAHAGWRAAYEDARFILFLPASTP